MIQAPAVLFRLWHLGVSCLGFNLGAKAVKSEGVQDRQWVKGLLVQNPPLSGSLLLCPYISP